MSNIQQVVSSEHFKLANSDPAPFAPSMPNVERVSIAAAPLSSPSPSPTAKRNPACLSCTLSSPPGAACGISVSVPSATVANENAPVSSLLSRLRTGWKTSKAGNLLTSTWLLGSVGVKQFKTTNRPTITKPPHHHPRRILCGDAGRCRGGRVRRMRTTGRHGLCTLMASSRAIR